ncbi:hypothetical protein NL676_029009 [Syzygium grande]|nr:hypothetical protein NL676_029009 [Syzygium grande]
MMLDFRRFRHYQITVSLAELRNSAARCLPKEARKMKRRSCLSLIEVGRQTYRHDHIRCSSPIKNQVWAMGKFSDDRPYDCQLDLINWIGV